VKTAGIPLAELKARYFSPGAARPKGLEAALRADGRAGALALAEQLSSERNAKGAETRRQHRLFTFERELWAQGHVHIAGVDEVGVGPLAGPVVAGAAILPQDFRLDGLDDSKKIVDEAERDELAQEIKRQALAWSVAEASVEEIDRLNIYHAALLAMRRAVEGLAITPHFVLVDARKVPGIPMPQRGIIKGDAKSLSIAAGAILAKTTRDAMMRKLGEQHPGYGFEDHKGYSAPKHLEALKRLGAIAEHRRSFAPVRHALGLATEEGDPNQAELFAEAEE
jgi:ribonuclease HII